MSRRNIEIIKNVIDTEEGRLLLVNIERRPAGWHDIKVLCLFLFIQVTELGKYFAGMKPNSFSKFNIRYFVCTGWPLGK